MALNKIKKNSITADAIDATKIADDAISEEHLDVTAITGNAELSASSASDDLLLIFDTSAGVVKKIQSSNVGVQGPTVSSISPTNFLTGDGTGNHTLVITGTGFVAGSTAKLVTSGGTDIAFDTVTINSLTQITGVVAKNTANLTNANEPFDVVVTAPNNIVGRLDNNLNINAQPVYVTSAGSLGTVTGNDSGLRFVVNANDPESAGVVTYELQSGTIPPGLSLSNESSEGGIGVISGTVNDPTATTTFNFVIRAVDAASNTSSRAFAITVNKQIQYQTFTASGTFAVPSGMSQLHEVLVVAGGGGGGGTPGQHGSGGGGAGGLIFMPNYPVTPGGTIAVTVGCGGGPAGAPAPDGPSGQDSVFGASPSPGLGSGGVLTAKGGSGGAGGGTPGSTSPGGSVGGRSQGTAPSAGSAIQPTQPGNSGAYGFGNLGGAGAHPSTHGAGGGGGAGAAGQNDAGVRGGGGGIGKAYTIADGTTPVYYAGGGGGGNGSQCTSPGNTPAGGQGGGARGGSGGGSGNGSGATGTANRGGGGGGSSNGNNAYGGGRGVVIVKY